MLVAVGPPTKMSGHEPVSTSQGSSGSSSRSRHSMGTPLRCIISRMLTAPSSYARDMPSASKCASGRLLSTAKSLRSFDAIRASMSGPGK